MVAPGVFELWLHPGGVGPLQDDVELRQTPGHTHSQSLPGTTLLAAGRAEAAGGLGRQIRCSVEPSRLGGLEVRLLAQDGQVAALGSTTVEHDLAIVELGEALGVSVLGSPGQLEGSSSSVGTAAG